MDVTLAALREYLPGGRWTRRVQPLPEHNLVFVKNAKAGTSTVLLWLHRLHTGEHGFTPTDNIHGVHTLPSIKDVGPRTVAGMLSGDAFRFSFVRDPITRVESAYLDKIVRQRYPRERRTLVQRTLELVEDPDVVPTFDQFVAAIEVHAPDPVRMDVHWRPQYLNLMHPLVEYDLLGRVETFEEDLTKVADAIGVPAVSVQAQNTTSREASLFEGRSDLLRKVQRVYARDFQLYGYDA